MTTSWLLPVVSTLVIIGVELIIRGGLVLQTAFPTPSAVFRALRWRPDVRVLAAVGNTLKGWAIGLGLAIVVAVPLGILVGTTTWMYRSVRFVVDFLRPIPSIALLPLLILVFGITLDLKIFMAALGAFFPLFFQTMYGVQDVDPVARDTASAYGLNRFMRFVFVDLPGATPVHRDGNEDLCDDLARRLRRDGDDRRRARARRRHLQGPVRRAPREMYALIVTTGLLGLLIAMGFTARALDLRWHPSQRLERPT